MFRVRNFQAQLKRERSEPPREPTSRQVLHEAVLRVMCCQGLRSLGAWGAGESEAAQCRHAISQDASTTVVHSAHSQESPGVRVKRLKLKASARRFQKGGHPIFSATSRIVTSRGGRGVYNKNK